MTGVVTVWLKNSQVLSSKKLILQIGMLLDSCYHCISTEELCMCMLIHRFLMLVN